MVSRYRFRKPISSSRSDAAGGGSTRVSGNELWVIARRVYRPRVAYVIEYTVRAVGGSSVFASGEPAEMGKTIRVKPSLPRIQPSMVRPSMLAARSAGSLVASLRMSDERRTDVGSTFH